MRELGALLGDVFAARTSAGAFELVESARIAAIDYRQSDVGSRETLRAELADLPAERAVELVTEISGRDGLLRREWLEESLARRNPYVDPLNLLQTRLLGQSHLTADEERTLRLTVKGIAAGMKNTG